MTHEPDPEIMDALHAHELLRDLEVELEIARLEEQKQEIASRLNELDVSQHVEEAEKLESAGFEVVEIRGTDTLIYTRDGLFYTRKAALKEA